MKASLFKYFGFKLWAAVLLMQLFFFQTVQSQESSFKVVNEVLFHIQRKAHTAADLRFFESINSELISDLDVNQQRIMKALSSFEMFVLYTICQIEAEALELQIDPKEQLFSESRVDSEKKNGKFGFLKANLYLQTKENLFDDRERFNSWFQMLKNKYDYSKKTNSISS